MKFLIKFLVLFWLLSQNGIIIKVKGLFSSNTLVGVINEFSDFNILILKYLILISTKRLPLKT